MRTIVLVLFSALLWIGCSDKKESEGEIKKEGGSVTLWTSKSELFMEYPALAVGKEANFAVHLTWLNDFSAVTEGTLQLNFTSITGETISTQSDKPASPGIFRPKILFQHPGIYSLQMILRGKMIDTLIVDTIPVYQSYEEIPTESDIAPETEQLISFLKEQQWKIDFKTERVVRKKMSGAIRATGDIQPKKTFDVVISAPFSGILLSEHNSSIPDIGKTVAKGEQIAVLTPAAQSPDGAENFSQLFAQAESEKQLAQSDFDRIQQLYEKQQVSQKEFQEAKARLKTANAVFNSLSRISAGTDNSGSFTISSPITGTIAATYFTLGKQLTAGEPMFRILNTSKVWLHINVSLSGIEKLNKPKRVEFRATGYSSLFQINEQNSRLISVGNIVDDRTRTLPIVFEVDNTRLQLRLGMFVDAWIKTGKEETVLAIPESALIEDEGRFSVYVHVEGESFAKREVTIGSRDKGLIEIISGVTEGERVVTIGAYQIRLASLSTQLPSHGHEH